MGGGLFSGVSHPYYPAKEKNYRLGDDIFMSQKEDKKPITVWLDDEENEMLKRYSKMCGLSQTEFIRQLCKGNTPKPEPPKAFWDMMNALYDVHSGFKACAKYEPSALEICKEIECLILDLQEAV